MCVLSGVARAAQGRQSPGISGQNVNGAITAGEDGSAKGAAVPGGHVR